MIGTIKMFCIRMNILSHRNNIVLVLAYNMALQNLYKITNNTSNLTNLSEGCFRGMMNNLSQIAEQLVRLFIYCCRTDHPITGLLQLG